MYKMISDIAIIGPLAHRIDYILVNRLSKTSRAMHGLLRKYLFALVLTDEIITPRFVFYTTRRVSYTTGEIVAINIVNTNWSFSTNLLCRGLVTDSFSFSI